MGLAAGLLQSVVWHSSGCESAGQNESADAACARAADGDGGTGPRSKSGRGGAASLDNKSRLGRLRSAARIGAPSRSRRENNGSYFSSRRSRDRSASFGHCNVYRLRDEFNFNSDFNERREFYRDGSGGGAAQIGRAAAVASALKNSN
jgi:hypothetical protein